MSSNGRTCTLKCQARSEIRRMNDRSSVACACAPIRIILRSYSSRNISSVRTTPRLPPAARPKRYGRPIEQARSEEHTSELQSLMRISYAVFCLKKKKTTIKQHTEKQHKTNKYTTRHYKHNKNVTRQNKHNYIET